VLIPIEVQGCDKPGFIEGFLKPVTCNSLNICYKLLWSENEQYQNVIVFPWGSHNVHMIFSCCSHSHSMVHHIIIQQRC
jgi:hypothetical protein